MFHKYSEMIILFIYGMIDYMISLFEFDIKAVVYFITK